MPPLVAPAQLVRLGPDENEHDLLEVTRPSESDKVNTVQKFSLPLADFLISISRSALVVEPFHEGAV